MPYNVTSVVRDGGYSYKERVEPGACGRSIRERGSKIRLFTQHDRGKLPIGKATELTEKLDGLHAAFEVANTRDGDDALELVKTGVVDSFSIGFKGVQERRDGDVTVSASPRCSQVRHRAQQRHQLDQLATAEVAGVQRHGGRETVTPIVACRGQHTAQRVKHRAIDRDLGIHLMPP